MKPRYIIITVLVVSVFLIALLPQLSKVQPLTGPQTATLAPTVALATDAAASENAASSGVNEPSAGNSPAAIGADDSQALIPIPELSAPGAAAGPLPQPDQVPDLPTFTASVQNGQAGTLVGVYAEGLFAFPIMQQPAGQDTYVSPNDQTLTQFARPVRLGVTALLAHNTLSGRIFLRLTPGQPIILVFGDGKTTRFQVASVQYYQALSPTDVHSDFIDLNGPESGQVSAAALYQKIYAQSGELVLQTCFEANGDPAWGRLFVLAAPAG